MSNPAGWDTRIVLGDCAFVAGPEVLDTPAADSALCEDCASYGTSAIAEHLLAYPALEEASPADPNWHAWQGVWREADRFIEIGFNPASQSEPDRWTGSAIWDADCTRGDVVKLWRHLQLKFPSVYLSHGGHTIHSPESFLAAPEENFG